MKPNYTPLKKLNDKSKGFKLKVKVVQKTAPAESPSKRRYQKLIFKDEEGTTIKGTLFGSDIETYEQALKRNGEYELSDVNVKHLPPQFRSRPDEEYQMNLGGRMKIRALDLSQCFDEPQYRQLANIPTTFNTDDSLLDIAAVVVFVGEEHEEKYADYNQQTRQIILADQSLSRPMKLTARNRYALTNAAQFMTTWQDNFQVVGFTGIRPSTYRGLSLTTTISTEYIDSPTGNIPDAVSDWMGTNMTLLSDWRAKAMLIYSETPSKIVTPLANIAHKKASTIWQDEYFWATVTLPNTQAQDVFFYYGCNNCGKRNPAEPGTSFYCHSCYTKDATAESRLVLNTELVDASGTLKVTAYTAETEKLFNLKADEFSALRKQDNATINKTNAELKNSQFLVKICPNHELSTANVLKWILSAVESIPTAKNITSDHTNTEKAHEEHSDKENTESTPVIADIGQTIDASEPTEEHTRTKKRCYNEITSSAEVLPHIDAVAEACSREGTSKQIADDNLEADDLNSTDGDTFDETVYAGESQDPEAKDTIDPSPTI